MPDFGEELKRLREEKGFTQAELAKMVGVTPGYISHVEKGIREGKVDVLFALCRALGVPCSHFEPFFPATAEPSVKGPSRSKKKPPRRSSP